MRVGIEVGRIPWAEPSTADEASTGSPPLDVEATSRPVGSGIAIHTVECRAIAARDERPAAACVGLSRSMGHPRSASMFLGLRNPGAREDRAPHRAASDGPGLRCGERPPAPVVEQDMIGRTASGKVAQAAALAPVR